MYIEKKQITKRTVQPSVSHPPVHWDRSNWSPYIFFQLDPPPETELHIKDFGFSNCSTNKENIFHDIHLERELEWGCVKEVDNGQTKYDCFHLSRIKVPVPKCNFSLSLNRTLRFSAVAVIPGLDILGNPETKYCVCDVRNTALPNQKYCLPWSSFPAGYYALTGIGNAPRDRDSHPLPLWISSTFLRAWESQ